MSPDDFRDSPSGRLAPTIRGCWAFCPHPLPPPLDLRPLVGPLTQAAHALGELSGLGHSMPNPYLLIRPFLRKEAVASSRIEGTVTSLTDLFLFEAGAEDAAHAPDAREVHNYVRALEYGLQRLDTLPVSLRLIRELHEILLSGVAVHRGAGITPGAFRRDQNWIGARQIKNARFVPPPPSEVMPALDALEKYIQAPDPDLPLLVRLALVHYQFEAIHPFPDGNGRVGRLLLPLLLCEQEALSQPMLYLSNYFERHYQAYIDSMYEVSRSGAWASWIAFFLRGVESECRSAIAAAKALQRLQAAYHERIRQARSSALLGRLVDLLFEAPAITIPKAAETLGIAYNAAKNNIDRLVGEGILRETTGAARPRLFIAPEILDVLLDRKASEGGG